MSIMRLLPEYLNMHSTLSKDIFVPVKAVPSSFLLSFLNPDPTPVTDKLYTITNDAEPEILFMGWTDANLWDKQILQLHDKKTFKREIVMRAHGHACWYARTVIPESCYNLEPSFFNRLYTERLTPLVYDEPRVKRIYCDFYPMNESCLEWYWVLPVFKNLQAPLWARLSNFDFLNRSNFYLLEIYLPDLMRFET